MQRFRIGEARFVHRVFGQSVVAEALLGRLPMVTLAGALAGAVIAFTLARVVWRASIGKYTSAGG